MYVCISCCWRAMDKIALYIWLASKILSDIRKSFPCEFIQYVAVLSLVGRIFRLQQIRGLKNVTILTLLKYATICKANHQGFRSLPGCEASGKVVFSVKIYLFCFRPGQVWGCGQFFFFFFFSLLAPRQCGKVRKDDSLGKCKTVFLIFLFI